MTWKVAKRAASRYRTLGRVTGLLSPQGERQAGSFKVVVTVETLERTPRPTRVSPKNRLALPDFSASLSLCGKAFAPRHTGAGNCCCCT